ncbi:ZIP family metal transporter [Pseudomonas citronellolis]|uniref:ZIP family metal transporter n=1 Tax=Pseudomonas citronellolis TaxID=53408 RepID=A0AAW6P936_9PSED|nr:ZIP family metal transporter [Pseudomonas citronellolis]MDF3843160.1 ZIP family metal transporter [Pseudomonas citronellolis]
MRPLEASARQGGARSLRWLLGLGIVLLGSGLLFNHLLLLARLQLPAPLYQALSGGLICALGTALGAVPVLLIRSMPARVADTLLGFGAGVMLAATAFSLLLPALEAVEAGGRSSLYAALLVSFGMALGVLGLMLAGRMLDDAPTPAIPSRILLFVAAIVLHNIPEGMAVGVAAGGEVQGAGGLALGIALQDVPEGLAIALVLAGAGMSRVRAMLAGAASGLVEPLFAVLCAWLVGVSRMLLPWGLALAAGAMLYVVVREIIPESQRRGYAGEATLGLIVGFCLMMVLDTSLG